MLAAASFLGYLGVRMLGTKRGILVASAAGGLASSTAVTVANARHSAAGEVDPALLAGGVALASAVSFLRVTVIVAVLHWALLRFVAPPLIIETVVAVALSLLPLRWRTGRNKATQRGAFRNPFAFWSVVGFAIFLGIIVVAGRAISERAGAAGAILGAAAMGIADVDAITVSIASLGSRVLSDQSAALAVLSGGDEYIEQAGHRSGHRKRALRPLPGHRVNGMGRSCWNCTLADARFPATIERN